MRTLVVNMYGGAGAGKTTAAMHTVSELKKRGYVTEYVSEYAKELVWEERYDLLDGSLVHQRQLLKEQQRRIDRLIGKVQIVVTDSPILLNAIYLTEEDKKEQYTKAVLNRHNRYDTFNLLVKRDVENFEKEGRIHNLEESIVKDNEITDLLIDNKIYYGTYTHSQLDTVVDNIARTYSRIKNKEEQKVKTIFFDTETTGLRPYENDEVVSISIVDQDANIILDTLVRPTHNDTWEEAERIHHISPEMVKDAPTIEELMPVINKAFRECDCFVAYNTSYDMGFIEPHLSETAKEGLADKYRDAMTEFAEIYGEWNEAKQGWKWKKLVEAAAYYNVEWQGSAHGSLADTLATRDVWYAMHPELKPQKELKQEATATKEQKLSGTSRK